jgi:hypothetical protein
MHFPKFPCGSRNAILGLTVRGSPAGGSLSVHVETKDFKDDVWSTVEGFTSDSDGVYTLCVSDLKQEMRYVGEAVSGVWQLTFLPPRWLPAHG